jgi:hypothetical protein
MHWSSTMIPHFVDVDDILGTDMSPWHHSAAAMLLSTHLDGS